MCTRTPQSTRQVTKVAEKGHFDSLLGQHFGKVCEGRFDVVAAEESAHRLISSSASMMTPRLASAEGVAAIVAASPTEELSTNHGELRH